MRLLWLSLGLIIVGIVVLSLIPPRSGMELATNDKVGHFIAYATLTLNAGLILEKRQWWWMFISALLFGGLMELLQGLVPGRMVSLYDMLANTSGVIIGSLILLTFKGFILKSLRRIKVIQ